MKITFFIIFLLATSISVLFAQDQADAVSGASEDAAGVAGEGGAVPGTASPARPSSGRPGLSFRFFGDFDVDAATAADFTGEPTFTFTQNHQALLIQAAGDPNLSIMADIFHPDDLFQLGLALGPFRLTAGRILIPFGEYYFHHMYGGRQDDEGLFLPKLWSDYGFSLAMPMGDKIGVELYAVNGFAPAGLMATAPRLYSVGKLDNDLAKAVGTRITLYPIPNARVNLSLYQDFWADDIENTASLAGLDGEFRLGPLGLRAGGVFGMVRGPGLSEFFRWSDYGEVKFDLTDTWALRLRGGAMDPDTRVSNAEDQNNANFSVIWRRGYVEYVLTYFRNWSGGLFSEDPATADKHQVLLKLLVVL